MKQWRLIYSHSDKENLWRGIYRRELIRHDETISAGGLKSDDPAWVEAVTRATETVMECDAPRYIIADTQDENGDYALLDADTGVFSPVVPALRSTSIRCAVASSCGSPATPSISFCIMF